MKEKLVKNHYKGFDRRVKVASLCCIGLFFATAAAFLPLTIIAQNNNLAAAQKAEEEKTQQANAKGDSQAKSRYKIVIEG